MNPRRKKADKVNSSVFSCDKCFQSYIRKDNLIRHIQNAKHFHITNSETLILSKQKEETLPDFPYKVIENSEHCFKISLPTVTDENGLQKFVSEYSEKVGCRYIRRRIAQERSTHVYYCEYHGRTKNIQAKRKSKATGCGSRINAVIFHTEPKHTTFRINFEHNHSMPSNFLKAKKSSPSLCTRNPENCIVEEIVYSFEEQFFVNVQDLNSYEMNPKNHSQDDENLDEGNDIILDELNPENYSDNNEKTDNLDDEMQAFKLQLNNLYEEVAKNPIYFRRGIESYTSDLKTALQTPLGTLDALFSLRRKIVRPAGMRSTKKISKNAAAHQRNASRKLKKKEQEKLSNQNPLALHNYNVENPGETPHNIMYTFDAR